MSASPPSTRFRRNLAGVLLGIGLFLSQAAASASVRTVAGIVAFACAAALIVLSRHEPTRRRLAAVRRSTGVRPVRSLWLGGGGTAFLVAGALPGASELRGPLLGFGLFLVATAVLTFFFDRGTGGTDLDIWRASHCKYAPPADAARAARRHAFRPMKRK